MTMAPLSYLSFRKVLLLYLILFLFACSCSIRFVSSETSAGEFRTDQRSRIRRLLGKDVEFGEGGIEAVSPKKNQTKLLKQMSSSAKNQTKLIKSSDATKGSELKKLTSGPKPGNSTKPIKKSSDLSKLSSPKNKTSSKSSQLSAQKTTPSSEKPDKTEKPTSKKKEIKPFWLDDEEDDDLVNEFRDLPTKFQRSLIPDLERISSTSKIYITKANKEMTRNFKPFFGTKYAPTIATAVSFIFILVPLLLVSLIFNRFKAYFSLQKILIFVQVYLSIYFSILCLSSIVTGLEPLKFFYATSRSTYVWLQIMQTLGYAMYLLLLLMYLVLVFYTECGLSLRLLGLAQFFVGFAVGLHYYMAVFHRVVLRQPPKTNWKVHGIYATCFLLICLFSRAERRKKEYVEDGGGEGKKN
ncbi:PREDICTED: uncharacterized protein LOC104824872 [Tarenaya hassleriana]|uniref:uncharacterized protein LOC104824872 n=1 Tax=Tarenaya hassleriana TaxID=28532 RepID=UPI00053C082F|nr:PREDICTED: uncharacterized protein LOC104824872 [Tarenaya hassleriana]